MFKWVMLFAAITVSGITGCATVRDVVQAGAKANDEAVATAVFTICNAASVGSIRRSFGTADKAQLWREMCSEGNDFSPLER